MDLKKLIERFNSLNDQARYGILVGVVFLVILLDVFFLLLPQMSDIGNVNDQIKKLSDDTQQVITDKGRINVLRKNLKEDRSQWAYLSGKVRPVQDVPAILSTISSVADEYGVKIDELVPEKNLQEALNKDADVKYYALPVQMKATCGYHRFGHFLNSLENGDLYFILSDFIIQDNSQDTKTELFSLTMKIILVDRNPKNP